MKLKQLQEKRGSLMKQVREILDLAQTETRAINGDEATKLTGLEAEIDGVDNTLQAEMRQLARESQAAPQLSKSEERDIGRFDLGIALRSLANGSALDGLEAEIIAEGFKEARAAGIGSNRGIMLPRMVVRKENRDITATGTTSTTGDQGGMTIATEKRGLADDFFNGSLMRALGATVFEGLTMNLDLPRITAGTAPAGKAENAGADEVSPLTAMLSLTPNRLPAFIDISDQLLLQSSTNIEAFIRMHLAAQMLAVSEAAFFHGSGTSEANGIAGTVGIGSVAGGAAGAAPTWAHLVGLETAVDTSNALTGRLAYASNGQIRGKLKTTPKVASTDSIMLLDDRSPNTINGYNAGFTNAISRTLTKGGSGAVASAIFFGNFSDYIMAFWGGLNIELIRDSANAKVGQHTLVANTFYDGGVIRPKSFAAMLDALGA
jgi:HK97 family phage major capsid protein